MIQPRIIVTGASGKTGSVVAAELLEAGLPPSNEDIARVAVRR